MKISGIYLFLCANFVATTVAYYRKCYDSFSLCLITNTTNDQFYWSGNFRLTRSSADKWCKEQSSSLAIITNETVQSAIEAFIGDSSAHLDSDVIITNGYRYRENTWKWVNGRQSVYQNSNPGYRYAYLVVSTGNTSVSFDPRASFPRKFICSFLNNNSSCPDGHQQLRGRCYKMHNERVTWFDARSVCLKEEGSDLATFEDGILSLTSEWRDEYWIGLLRERWSWTNKETAVDLNYYNWDFWNPSSTFGNCLCLRVTSGKWKDCDCSQKYRYVCIQDYASASGTTGSTTFLPPAMSSPTSPLFKSTSTRQMLHDVSKMDIFKNLSTVSSQSSSDSQRLIIWVPLVLLIVLILVLAAVASCVIIKKFRTRKRLTRQEAPSTTNSCQPESSIDTYATLNREYLNANRTYAELNVYETIRDEKQDIYAN